MTPAALSAVAFACLVAMEARAQQAPAPAEAASAAPKSSTLDAIVITAQKRKEDVRKVPLSVSAAASPTCRSRRRPVPA
jgi:outer membrane receptor protein involved in Fe transport